jgi:hypothetical protein
METDIMTKNEAICLVYLLPFTEANLLIAKEALKNSRLEICYKGDPQLPFLLPLTTYNRALRSHQIQTFPE